MVGDRSRNRCSSAGFRISCPRAHALVSLRIRATTVESRIDHTSEWNPSEAPTCNDPWVAHTVRLALPHHCCSFYLVQCRLDLNSRYIWGLFLPTSKEDAIEMMTPVRRKGLACLIRNCLHGRYRSLPFLYHTLIWNWRKHQSANDVKAKQKRTGRDSNGGRNHMCEVQIVSWPHHMATGWRLRLPGYGKRRGCHRSYSSLRRFQITVILDNSRSSLASILATENV